MNTPRSIGNSKPGVKWPTSDFSRVPYEIFFEQKYYNQEMEKIFLGPTWNYLAHSCEIPNEGDFVTNWIGDTNVIVNRATNGEIHAFKNSCSHRGTRIVDEIRGNSTRHVGCILERVFVICLYIWELFWTPQELPETPSTGS